MTGSRELLEALPRHETAHAALLTDILDVMRGASPAATDQHPYPQPEELSPGELRVLRYLPTNLSRPQIAGELSVSPGGHRIPVMRVHLPAPEHDVMDPATAERKRRIVQINVHLHRQTQM